jgi:hypothetical protein
LDGKTILLKNSMDCWHTAVYNNKIPNT